MLLSTEAGFIWSSVSDLTLGHFIYEKWKSIRVVRVSLLEEYISTFPGAAFLMRDSLTS